MIMEDRCPYHHGTKVGETSYYDRAGRVDDALHYKRLHDQSLQKILKLALIELERSEDKRYKIKLRIKDLVEMRSKLIDILGFAWKVDLSKIALDLIQPKIDDIGSMLGSIVSVEYKKLFHAMDSIESQLKIILEIYHAMDITPFISVIRPFWDVLTKLETDFPLIRTITKSMLVSQFLS